MIIRVSKQHLFNARTLLLRSLPLPTEITSMIIEHYYKTTAYCTYVQAYLRHTYHPNSYFPKLVTAAVSFVQYSLVTSDENLEKLVRHLAAYRNQWLLPSYTTCVGRLLALNEMCGKNASKELYPAPTSL